MSIISQLLVSEVAIFLSSYPYKKPHLLAFFLSVFTYLILLCRNTSLLLLFPPVTIAIRQLSKCLDINKKMYGIVNKGIRDMVINNHGHIVWEEIKNKAECDVVFFTNTYPYADSITYNLVEAASKVLNISTHEVFVSFGEYWIIHTVHEGYGPLLKLAGNSFYEILSNLDDLHVRVGHTFLNQSPPSFICKEINDHTLVLEYHSNREGLSSLIIGMLQGLGKSFNKRVEIKHLIKREEKGHDEFLVKHFPLKDSLDQIDKPTTSQLNKSKNGKKRCPFSPN